MANSVAQLIRVALLDRLRKSQLPQGRGFSQIQTAPQIGTPPDRDLRSIQRDQEFFQHDMQPPPARGK